MIGYKYNLKEKTENILLKNRQTYTFDFSYDKLDKDANHKLFFTCEDASWSGLKNESGAELLYMLIDDSLNAEEAEWNKFCLDFSCKKPLPYAKRVMKKILWQPLRYGLFGYSWVEEKYCDEWTFGLYAKAKDLKVEKGGYLHIRVDKWLLKDGVNPKDTTLPPDETLFIDIPEGTYGYTKLWNKVIADKYNTACVIMTVEGEGYSGNVYFERPFLEDSCGMNLLPDFDRCSIGIEHTAWFGQNLMKREWPRFKVEVNGKTCFDDEVFLKIHRFSPVEIELEDAVFNNGTNTISITYFGDYYDAIPVLIDEVYLLETEKKPFNVVRCPDSVIWGEKTNILVETDVSPVFESSDFELIEVSEFNEVGFKVISIVPVSRKNNLKFTLKYNDTVENYTVKRCVEKTEDNVIAGSGDMIYIDISDVKSVRNYIKWYVENDVGNLLTIRQVYRWGGQRSVNPKVWEMVTSLCEKLGIHYVHISDGRDIPGLATNPTEKMLSGCNFLGRQLHERDGQLFYWGEHPAEIQAPLEEFYDLAARLGREYPDTIEGAYRPFNIEYSEAGYSFRRNFSEIPDVKKASEFVAKELNALSGDNFGRHTGPAVVFKYFYENGFDWCGAETMDGATESLLAFLRGASNAYGKERTGVHLALQWSTFPHNTEQRYRRYLLSLYIPYMHGITDVNTEEGLWFMEAYYAYHNRLSAPCERNRQVKHKFNSYIRTHSRTGRFYTPVGLLHGNLDGWNGFNAQYNWGMPSMPTWEDAESWKILKIFYPQNAVEKIGFKDMGAIFEGNDKPNGVFSSTPMGNVDVIPAECGDLSGYSLLAFAGYNCMTDDIVSRIDGYVKNGGKLICAWPHFSDTTLYTDIVDYKLNIVDCEITQKLSAGNLQFVSDTVNGKDVIVCANTPENIEIVEETDRGIPFVYSINYGCGEIIFVNTLYYPGNENVLPVYESVVRAETSKILEKQPVKVACDEDVEYTIYLQKNGVMHYYFTAVDWYNDADKIRKSEISFEANSYSVEFKFGELIKVVTDGKRAVWPRSYMSEVLELTDTCFKVQGEGVQIFYVAQKGRVEEYEVDFDKQPVVIINF